MTIRKAIGILLMFLIELVFFAGVGWLLSLLNLYAGIITGSLGFAFCTWQNILIIRDIPYPRPDGWVNPFKDKMSEITAEDILIKDGKMFIDSGREEVAFEMGADCYEKLLKTGKSPLRFLNTERGNIVNGN